MTYESINAIATATGRSEEKIAEAIAVCGIGMPAGESALLEIKAYCSSLEIRGEQSGNIEFTAPIALKASATDGIETVESIRARAAARARAEMPADCWTDPDRFFSYLLGR